MSPDELKRRIYMIRQANPSLRDKVAPSDRPSMTQEQSNRVQAGLPADPNQPQAEKPQDFGHKALGFLRETATAPFRPLAQGFGEVLSGGKELDAINNQNKVDSQNMQTYNDLWKRGKISREQYVSLLTGSSEQAQQNSRVAQEAQNRVDKSKALGSLAQTALTVAAPTSIFGHTAPLASKVALSAAEGATFGAANEFTQNADPTLKGGVKQTVLGGVIGGIMPLAAKGGSKLLSKVPGPVGDFFTSKANKAEKELLSKAIAKETSPTKIEALIKKEVGGLDKQTVDYLANESNPEAIRQVLDTITGSTPEALKPVKVKPQEPEAPKTVAEADQALRFSEAAQNAKELVKQPGAVAKAVARGAESPDAVTAITQSIAKSPNKREVTAMVEGLFPTIEGNEKNRLVKALTKETDPEAVTKLLGEQANKVNVVPEAAPAVTPEATIEQAAKMNDGTAAPTPVTPDAPANVAPTAEATQVGETVNANADKAVAKATPTAAEIAPGASPEAQAEIQKIMDKLPEAQQQFDKVAKTRTAEKASRSAQAEAAYRAAGGGEEGMRAKLAALRGKYSESGFSPVEASPEAQKLILDDIANSNLKTFEKTNTQNAIRKIWGALDKKPTPSDIRYIREYFGQDFGDAVEQAVQESPTTWREKLGQVLGAPRSVMASFDLSGTLRQGGVLASRFPKEAANAFKEEVKYFGSENAFKQGMAEIAGRDSFEKMVNSGLAVDAAQGLTSTEEQFASNLAEKIPGFGRGIKASDRAYSGFLAKLRADSFDSFVKTTESKLGRELSEQETKDIASFINSASGRGDLGKYLEQHSTTLSATLFSPRYWKSRLDLLNPVYYAKLSGPARKLALQTAGTFAAEASAVLGLASMAGAAVETDMRSSDFGKIKVGNTRYDILGGLQQNLVFAWRELSGEKKSSETGEVTSLTDPKFGGTDRLGVATDLFSSKMNPTLSVAGRLLKGKDRGGNPVNPITELAKLAIPIPISGTYDTIKSGGGSITNPKDVIKGIAKNSPDIFGISAQTYGTPKNAAGEYSGKIEPNMVTDDSGKVILDEKGRPVKVDFPKDATDLQKKALLDDKRQSALTDQYKRTLSKEDQALLGLSQNQLDKYLEDGTIDQGKYDYIDEQRQMIKNVGGIDVPTTVKSEYAKEYYREYNSLSKKNKEQYLEGTSNNAKVLADTLNKKRPKGLGELKGTNKLAKAYAEYEKDQNENDYTEVERNNKAKAFFSYAYKEQQPQPVQETYKEGGSDDMKQLLAEGKVDKADLDAAIKLDDELFAAGLTGSLKFSKKFRASYGYGTPSGAGGGSGGGSDTKNAHLANLLPSYKKGSSASSVPNFSPTSRGIKLKTSVPQKSTGNSKRIRLQL